MSTKSTKSTLATASEMAASLSTAPAPATAMESSSIFREVLKRQLHPSPTNPRKEFPEGPIAEMEASVRERGVIQPLIVRRWPEKDRAGEEAFEIVCGERRFRGASRVAELERLPVIVRAMSDTEVLEIQLIENLQREDVSPYDEAVGYAEMLKLRSPEGVALYSPERIAERIGKAVGYVRNRLKMQRTPKKLLEALKRGLIGTRICELVGRIPHAEDRERCAEEVLEPECYDRPMSIEEAQAHVHEEYMVPLVKAPFDRKAVDLLPKAGSCEECRFRTGKDPDLAEDIASGLVGGGKTAGIDPHLCQNPKCFRDKCEAFYARVKAADPERIVGEAEAKSIFDDYGNVKLASRMKRADRKPDYSDVGHWDTGKLKPWSEYARKLGVPVKLAKNPRTGAVVELVDSSAVKEAERLAAPEKPVFEQGKRGEGKKGESYEAAERRRKELEAEEVRVAFDRVSGNLVGQVGREELLTILAAAVDHPGIDVVLRWMGVKAGAPKRDGGVVSARAHKIEAIVAAVRADEGRFDREAILILVLMAQFAEGCSYNGLGSSRFKEFASARGVDFKEVKAAAKAAVREREKLKSGKAERPNSEARKRTKADLKRDVALVMERFEGSGKAMTRAAIGQEMEWSDERTLEVYDELQRRQKGDAPPQAAGEGASSVGDDAWAAVRYFGRVAGSSMVSAVRIGNELGWDQGRAFATSAYLVEKGMVKNGVLDREHAEVQAILAWEEPVKEGGGAMVQANLPGSGKSKLAAESVKSEGKSTLHRFMKKELAAGKGGAAPQAS